MTAKFAPALLFLLAACSTRRGVFAPGKETEADLARRWACYSPVPTEIPDVPDEVLGVYHEALAMQMRTRSDYQVDYAAIDALVETARRRVAEAMGPEWVWADERYRAEMHGERK